MLVIGTRIIGRDTLAAVPAPFINYHAGINPKYRGKCGGYWSLARGDHEHFGVTVHLVDLGVDTGGILHWDKAVAEAGDNFATYHFLLAAVGRAVVLRALDDVLCGRMRSIRRKMPSQQWYHPTLWNYLWTGFTRKVC